MEKVDEIVDQIEVLLFQLDDYLLENGLLKLSGEKRIKIPSSKISTAYRTVQRYSLDKLIKHGNIRDNIAYSIMLHQLLKYLWLNFKLWGIVGDMYLKNLIINHFAIIEALLYGSLIGLHEDCKIDFELCKHASKCPVYIKSKGKMTFAQVLETYETKISLYEKDIFDQIIQLKERRDEVHIYDIKYHIYHKQNKFRDEINSSEVALEFLRLNLLPKIEEFKVRRKEECRIGIF